MCIHADDDNYAYPEEIGKYSLYTFNIAHALAIILGLVVVACMVSLTRTYTRAHTLTHNVAYTYTY